MTDSCRVCSSAHIMNLISMYGRYSQTQTREKWDVHLHRANGFSYRSSTTGGLCRFLIRFIRLHSGLSLSFYYLPDQQRFRSASIAFSRSPTTSRWQHKQVRSRFQVFLPVLGYIFLHICPKETQHSLYIFRVGK